MASGVSTVYINVIDDVVSKVRDEFVASGAGEHVLAELQALWEMKMMQCGAISGSIERSSIPKTNGAIAPVHDLNVPYEGPIEEYETPTAEMLFPPTPAQTPAPQTPLPDPAMYNMPTPINEIRNDVDLKSARPSPYMQPPSPWMSQRPLGVDVNVAYVEGRDDVDRGASQQNMTQDFLAMSSGKRKRDDYASRVTSGSYLPQQDGSGDITIEFCLPEASENQNSFDRHGQEFAVTEKLSNEETRLSRVIPQHDGIQDEFDNLFHFQGGAGEDYNTPTPADHAEFRAATPSVGTPKPAKSETGDDDEPPLNEDDDDDEVDDPQEGEEPHTQHLILAQFDKVTRTKSRWKCTLKDGIMHINGRDVLFNKATGEFDF